MLPCTYVPLVSHFNDCVIRRLIRTWALTIIGGTYINTRTLWFEGCTYGVKYIVPRTLTIICGPYLHFPTVLVVAFLKGRSTYGLMYGSYVTIYDRTFPHALNHWSFFIFCLSMASWRVSVSPIWSYLAPYFDPKSSNLVLSILYQLHTHVALQHITIGP